MAIRNAGMNRSACGSRKQTKPKMPVKPFKVMQKVRRSPFWKPIYAEKRR